MPAYAPRPLCRHQMSVRVGGLTQPWQRVKGEVWNLTFQLLVLERALRKARQYCFHERVAAKALRTWGVSSLGKMTETLQWTHSPGQKAEGTRVSWVSGTSPQPCPFRDTEQPFPFAKAASSFCVTLPSSPLLPTLSVGIVSTTHCIDSRMRFHEGARGLVSLCRSTDRPRCPGAHRLPARMAAGLWSP